MDISSYERNLEITERCDGVLPAFGIHPWNAQKVVQTLDFLNNSVTKSTIIGEIGLDYHFVKVIEIKGESYEVIVKTVQDNFSSLIQNDSFLKNIYEKLFR